MRKFKPFMRNKCNHRYCQSYKCEQCPEYNPHLLSIQINKKLANILYNIEYWLINLEFSDVFY